MLTWLDQNEHLLSFSSSVSHSSLFRVICLCAQFEAVLQHGLRKTRGLALTAAALKQAAGFSSKNEGGTSASAPSKSTGEVHKGSGVAL